MLTADAMISLLVWSRLSTACAAPLVTLKVDPFGALMVASVLCSHHPKDQILSCGLHWLSQYVSEPETHYATVVHSTKETGSHLAGIMTACLSSVMRADLIESTIACLNRESSGSP